ncbi:hypothetical protein [Stenotrophomonas maltophilia]|uniref:hypothetical protein n=1 Tax=Stenotrophomonas TaxID=40323 RepID=UPI0013D8E675|nr:hypothetical protein [Stenotrophomonas maltophilia]
MSLPPLNFVPLTELDSVNNLLMSIGQSPVNSLAVPGVKDVSIAQLTLHNTSREVQSKGWWFNTETAYPLPLDVNRMCVLPANAMETLPDDTTLVERAGKLYDTVNRTFVLKSPPTATLNLFLAYSELPQVARRYIEARAGRVFQSNIVGSPILYQFTKEMEAEASVEMDRNNLRGKKPNWFTSGATSNRIFSRS